MKSTVQRILESSVSPLSVQYSAVHGSRVPSLYHKIWRSSRTSFLVSHLLCLMRQPTLELDVCPAVTWFTPIPYSGRYRWNISGSFVQGVDSPDLKILWEQFSVGKSKDYFPDYFRDLDVLGHDCFVVHHALMTNGSMVPSVPDGHSRTADHNSSDGTIESPGDLVRPLLPACWAHHNDRLEIWNPSLVSLPSLAIVILGVILGGLKARS